MFERIYLDLDRTLYDTDRGLKLIAAACQDLWPDRVTAVRLIEEAPRFYSSSSPMGLHTHELFRQLKAYGVDLTVEQEKLRQALSTYDLLYPDAYQLLDFLDDRRDIEVKIITFGENDYQRFKLSLLPRLHGYPVIITMKDKGTFLADNEKPAKSLIVDDRIASDLPEWCEGVLVDRTKLATQPFPVSHTVEPLVIHNLIAVEKLLGL